MIYTSYINKCIEGEMHDIPRNADAGLSYRIHRYVCNGREKGEKEKIRKAASVRKATSTRNTSSYRRKIVST